MVEPRQFGKAINSCRYVTNVPFVTVVPLLAFPQARHKLYVSSKSNVTIINKSEYIYGNEVLYIFVYLVALSFKNMAYYASDPELSRRGEKVKGLGSTNW